MNAELARYVMEQTIAKILFHSGFEGIFLYRFGLIFDFQPFAFDVITGVAIEYLQDIGRTLTMYMNNNDSRKKYTEEVNYLCYVIDIRNYFCMLWI